MSLFLKIFFWFWFAMALIVGALTLVTRTFQNEPIVRQWQVVVSRVVELHSETAAQIYSAQGKDGLELFLRRFESSERTNAVGLFRQNGEEIAVGGKFQFDTTGVLQSALASDETVFERVESLYLFGKKSTLANGETVVFLTQWERPHDPDNFTLSTRQIAQIFAVFLTAGLVCYALASYLSSPIVKLRRATRKFAEGDLHTRLDIRRRDELGDLAREFDQMAERIETLVASEKRLTQDISHELRSPLARLNVALELARSRANPEVNGFIERIGTESNRLNEMISRLLVLSKLENSSENFEKHETNLTRLLEQVVTDADFEAHGNRKSVKILQNDQVKVLGNENLLRSAIENVLRNAVRYTQEETAVEVSLVRQNKSAVVSVRDHGAGVPEEELEKLFKPFYRVHAARERKTGGIGLGLAIAERAVHAHHGTITARNTEDGLLVEISFPVVQSNVNRPAAARVDERLHA